MGPEKRNSLNTTRVAVPKSRGFTLCLLLAGILSILFLCTRASRATIMGWADKYIIGSSWVDLKSNTEGDADVSTFHQYNQSYSSWSNIGRQYRPQMSNAITQMGGFLRDRTGNQCGFLHIDIFRRFNPSWGVHHSVGDTCERDEFYEWWPGHDDGNATREQDTCDWSPSETFVSSRTLEIDHSLDSSFLFTSGSYNWEYIVKSNSYVSNYDAWPPWFVTQDTDSDVDCFNIFWFN
jgi:hypothetical protein